MSFIILTFLLGHEYLEPFVGLGSMFALVESLELVLPTNPNPTGAPGGRILCAEEEVAGTKHKGVAYSPESYRGQAEVQEVLHSDARRVLGLDEPDLDRSETSLHGED